jgi:putative flippase GtrA
MPLLEPLRALFPRAVGAIDSRIVLLRKAMSFALIGVVNTLVDATIFFVGYTYLTSSPEALGWISELAASCRCASADNLRLILINLSSWLIAVSGSYMMNSFFTFAAESGRRLRWRAYATFVVSSVVGAVANTATLVLVAQILPVWMAKASAILVSFLVNFSMSHFVVFRPRTDAQDGH